MLAENPHATRLQLASGIGISENGIKKIISNLKASGRIRRIGSNKSGYWEILQSPEK